MTEKEATKVYVDRIPQFYYIILLNQREAHLQLELYGIIVQINDFIRIRISL